MKIRPLVLWTCVFAIALLVLLWIAKRPAENPISSHAPVDALAESERRPNTVETQREEIAPASRRKVTPRRTPPPVNSTGTETKEERSRSVLSELNHVPIIFYGKLEDQFGSPVVGAEIAGNTIINNGVTEGVGKAYTTSDINGFFKLDAGKGVRLGIMPRKSGYALASLNGGGIYSHMWPETERQHPDPNRPIVVKMWKLQGAEPLVTLNQSYKFRFTNEPIYFDLIENKVVPHGGDVKLTVTRPAGDLSQRNKQDWSLQIEAVDGGLIKTAGEESVTYWAPETGYVPSYTFLMSTNGTEKWFDNLQHGFFVQSRNGQIYSKIGISFRLNEKPEGFMYIRFSGVANTNGSRNWEGAPNTYKPR